MTQKSNQGSEETQSNQRNEAQRLDITIISSMEKADLETYAIFDENKFLAIIPYIFSEEFESHFRNSIREGKRLQHAKEEFAAKKLIEIICSKIDFSKEFEIKSDSSRRYLHAFFNNLGNKIICKSLFAASVFGAALKINTSITQNNMRHNLNLMIYDFENLINLSSSNSGDLHKIMPQNILNIFNGTNIKAYASSKNDVYSAQIFADTAHKKIAKITSHHSIMHQIQQNKECILSGNAFICNDKLTYFADKILCHNSKSSININEYGHELDVDLGNSLLSIADLTTRILLDKSEFYLKPRMINLCALLYQIFNANNTDDCNLSCLLNFNKIFKGRYITSHRISEELTINGERRFEFLLMSLISKKKADLSTFNGDEYPQIDIFNIWKCVAEIIRFSIDKIERHNCDSQITITENVLSKIDDFFGNQFSRQSSAQSGPINSIDLQNKSEIFTNQIADVVKYFCISKGDFANGLLNIGHNNRKHACSKFLFFCQENYLYKGDFAIKDAYNSFANNLSQKDESVETNDYGISGDLFGDNAPQEYLSSKGGQEDLLNFAQSTSDAICANSAVVADEASARNTLKSIINSASFKNRCINDAIFNMSQHEEVEFYTIEKGLSGESVSHERAIFKLEESVRRFGWNFEFASKTVSKTAYEASGESVAEGVDKLPIFGAPQLQFRPKSLAATSIESLIKHPFVFYLKNILKLKKIDYEPQSASVKGNALHEVAEEVAKKIEEEIAKHIAQSDKEDKEELLKKEANAHKYSREISQKVSYKYGLTVVDEMYVTKAAEEITDFCIEHALMGCELLPEEKGEVDIEIVAKVKKEDGTDDESQRITISAICDLVMIKRAKNSEECDEIIIVDYKTGSIQSISFSDFKKYAQLATAGIIFKRQSSASKSNEQPRKTKIENLIYIKPSLTEDLEKKESKNALKNVDDPTGELISNFEAFFIKEMQEYYCKDESGELKKYLFDESVAISNHEVQYFHIARVGDFLFSR